VAQRLKITGVSVTADGSSESVKAQFGPVSVSETV
jgi:hypothetical protein